MWGLMCVSCSANKDTWLIWEKLREFNKWSWWLGIAGDVATVTRPRRLYLSVNFHIVWKDYVLIFKLSEYWRMKFIKNLTQRQKERCHRRKKPEERGEWKHWSPNGDVQQFQEPVNAQDPAQQDVQRRSNGNNRYVADFNGQKDSKVAV